MRDRSLPVIELWASASPPALTLHGVDWPMHADRQHNLIGTWAYAGACARSHRSYLPLLQWAGLSLVIARNSSFTSRNNIMLLCHTNIGR